MVYQTQIPIQENFSYWSKSVNAKIVLKGPQVLLEGVRELLPNIRSRLLTSKTLEGTLCSVTVMPSDICLGLVLTSRESLWTYIKLPVSWALIPVSDSQKALTIATPFQGLNSSYMAASLPLIRVLPESYQIADPPKLPRRDQAWVL